MFSLLIVSICSESYPIYIASLLLPLLLNNIENCHIRRLYRPVSSVLAFNVGDKMLGYMRHCDSTKIAGNLSFQSQVV